MKRNLLAHAAMAAVSLGSISLRDRKVTEEFIGGATMVNGPGQNGNFDTFRVTDPGQSEVLRQPLYDFLLYPAAGQAQFSFFQQPVGQGLTSTPGAVAGSPKTFADTNMSTGGQLPSGLEYLIEQISVYFFAGSVSTANTFTPVGVTTDATGVLAAAAISANNDMVRIYNEGLLEFNVLQKNQIRDTPLRLFAPSNWMETDSSLSTTVATTSLAISNTRPKGDPYILNPNISIQPTVNFGVNITYPGARTLPSTFNGRIGVRFDCLLKRAAQ
jgi:hypothetical protein